MDSTLIAEARAWLSDLQWADEPDFDAMPEDEIVRGIKRHYDGGWPAFVSDGAQ